MKTINTIGMKTINTIGMAIITTRKENVAKKQKENKPTEIKIIVIIAKTICIKKFNILLLIVYTFSEKL